MLPIILVNYNSTVDTIRCVNSILQSTNIEYKVIIVDNNSKKSEYNKLRYFIESLSDEQRSRINLIRSNVNNGFAAGNNIGIRYSFDNLLDWDFIWILNNDTVINPESISEILNYSKTIDRKCGIWGHLLLYLDNPSIIQAAGGRYNKFLGKGYNVNAHCPNINKYRTPDRLDYIIGASMIVRKPFIEEVGFMNEEYFLFFEELDWIERGRTLGWSIDYNPLINILHAHGGSTLKQNKVTSLFSIKCSFRSRILFTKKFHMKFLPFVLITCISSSLYRISKGNIKTGFHLLYTSFKAVFSNSL